MPSGKTQRFSSVGLFGAITGALGLVVSIFALGNSYQVLEMTKTIATTEMITNLRQDFDSNPLFREIRVVIGSCKHVYEGYGGNYHSGKVNQYLNFFEEIGYMQKEGYLNLKEIDFFFGANIVEAYEHPDILPYIESLQNNGQGDAFTGFKGLGRWIKDSTAGRVGLANRMKRKCKISLAKDS